MRRESTCCFNSNTHAHKCTHTAHYLNTAGHGSSLPSSSYFVCVCTSEAKANTRCVKYTHISTHTPFPPPNSPDVLKPMGRWCVCVCGGSRLIQLSLLQNLKQAWNLHFVLYVGSVDLLRKNKLPLCRYCLKSIVSVFLSSLGTWTSRFSWKKMHRIDNKGKWVWRLRTQVKKRQGVELVSGTAVMQLCVVSVGRLVCVSQRIPLRLSNRLSPVTPPHHWPHNGPLLLVPLGPWTSPTLRLIQTLHLRVSMKAFGWKRPEPMHTCLLLIWSC